MIRVYYLNMTENVGLRPRNPKSYDCSIELSSLCKTENMWELIEKKLGI